MQNMNGLPVLNAQGKTFGEAYENAVITLAEQGSWYNREHKKDKGQLQVDATMNIITEEPDAQENFINKGLVMRDSLGILDYIFEMLGAKNGWMKKNLADKTDTKWEYTYNSRITNHQGTNQLNYVIERLAKNPFSRRAQIITWIPEYDDKIILNENGKEQMLVEDPPCLQRIQFLNTPNNEDGLILNMNYEFRSRNVMIAAHENVIGLYAIQCYVRDALRKKGLNISNGRIKDEATSFHIKHDDIKYLEDFKERIKHRKDLEDRCYTREEVFSNWEQDFNEAYEFISRKKETNHEELNQAAEYLQEFIKKRGL